MTDEGIKVKIASAAAAAVPAAHEVNQSIYYSDSNHSHI
jgi:hypothetical protein